MKRYTAQEMRSWAGRIEFDGPVQSSLDACRIAAMLRQAADDMERKRKYEYGIDYTNKTNGNVCSNHHHFDSLKQAKRYATPLPDEEVRFVRREVGAWEEVEDEV